MNFCNKSSYIDLKPSEKNNKRTKNMDEVIECVKKYSEIYSKIIVRCKKNTMFIGSNSLQARILNKIREEGVEENVFGTMSAETKENLFVIIFLKNKVDKFYLYERDIFVVDE